jgi:hypothetical protein
MNNERPSSTFTSTLGAPLSETQWFNFPAWLRLSARLLAPSLDERLAAGEHPATSDLLAARSQQLMSVGSRHGIAESWLRLLIEARRPFNPFDISVPLMRRDVLDAEDQIRSLAEALVSPLPTVRGVAMSLVMLRDGAGPLFNKNCEIKLADALERAITQLDPLVTSN